MLDLDPENKNREVMVVVGIWTMLVNSNVYYQVIFYKSMGKPLGKKIGNKIIETLKRDTFGIIALEKKDNTDYYQLVTCRFPGVPKKPVGGYEDFVDELVTAFSAAESPIINGPLVLLIKIPPRSGVLFYVAQAASRTKRFLNELGYQMTAEEKMGLIPDSPAFIDHKNIYVTVNPEYTEITKLYENYKFAEKQNVREIYIAICKNLPIPNAKENLTKSDLVEDDLDSFKIPYEIINMRKPGIEDYKKAFTSQYTPNKKDIKNFGSADEVLEIMAETASNENLGIEFVPRALRYAAFRYSGRRVPSLDDIINSYHDVLRRVRLTL